MGRKCGFTETDGSIRFIFPRSGSIFSISILKTITNDKLS